jgi:hypothetical protein
VGLWRGFVAHLPKLIFRGEIFVAVVVLKLKNKTNVLGKLFRGHFVLAIEFS